MLWPYLYLLLFYRQSPTFVDSSGGVPLPVGVAVALADAALAMLVLGIAYRRDLPNSVVIGVTVGVAVAAYLLPGATGPAAIGLCLVVQLGAAGAVGRTVGPSSGVALSRSPGPRSDSRGGAVVFAGATLAFTLHTIQPLPFSNRFIPAAVGLTLAVAALVPRPATADASAVGLPITALVVGLATLAVVVPVAVAATWPTPATVAVGGRPLRVMTFNVQQGVTLGQLDLEQIARVVDAAHPDVVVMEEVGRGWSVSGMTDESEWLRRRLRMEDAWGPAADHQFGNLVLSRAPITRRDVLALGRGTGTQDRSAVFVSVDLGNGRQIQIIGTHLQNGSPAKYHRTRAEEYRAILAHWNGQPSTVFIGDLNTYPRHVPPGWPELDLVVDAGFRTTQNLDRCTMPTSNANCPDWIFVTGDQALSPVTIVIDRPDHRPIVATVTRTP